MSQTQASLDQEINSTLVSGNDITAAQLRQVLHDMNAGIFQDGVTGFNTPANSVGLASSAGTATTAMRSDATLALSQSITPTWTGPHAFSNSTPSTTPTTGAVTVTGGMGIAGMLNLGGTLNAAGSIYVNLAPVEVAQRATGTVSGTVSTTDITFSLPTGATLISVRAYTTTAFLATGTINLTAGSAAGDTAYITSQNIKALGLVVLNLNGTGIAGMSSLPAGTPNFFVRITQTGTPSAVGSAVIVVGYLVP